MLRVESESVWTCDECGAIVRVVGPVASRPGGWRKLDVSVSASLAGAPIESVSIDACGPVCVSAALARLAADMTLDERSVPPSFDRDAPRPDAAGWRQRLAANMAELQARNAADAARGGT